jgi:hypothetical protein
MACIPWPPEEARRRRFRPEYTTRSFTDIIEPTSLTLRVPTSLPPVVHPRRRGPTALNATAVRADNSDMHPLRWRAVAAAVAVAAVLGLAPLAAHATAGFAERHSELAYNDIAAVHWIHPGDGCDCGGTCFQLVRRNDRFARFAGLEGSLSQLSVPASATQTLVIAQCCADGAWVVYDLAHERQLVRTPDRGVALARWRALGLAPPRLAEAGRGAHGLHQTWASRVEDWAFLLLMWLPVLMLLMFVVGMVRFVSELKAYLATKRVVHLMWCGVLLLPALSVAWFVLRVVLGVGHRFER